MRSSPLAVAILLAVGAGSVVARPPDVPLSAAKTVDDTRALYIVQFAEPALATFDGAASGTSKLAGLQATSPKATGARKLDVEAAASKAYRSVLAQVREERLATAAGMLGRPLDPLFVYDVALNGVALELTATEAAALARLDGVAAVEKDRLHRLQTDAGPRWLHADAVWTAVAPQGNRGEGIVIGVIDSGINATHPSFAATGPVDGHVHANPAGRLFGLCATNASSCNAKLIGIHDFTVCTGTHNTSGCGDDEANDGSDKNNHGTHVASTAAGNTLNASVDFGTGTPVTRSISGVAPHANVIAYKACEEEASCRGTWLLASVNQAVADGVDVINYSIGGDPRNPWTDSVAMAMLAAREAGITVVAAAGNEGPAPGSLTSTGNAPWVVAVANTTHDRAIVNRLSGLSGGATAPPEGGVLLGVGATAGVGPAPIVYAGNFGSPLCATGTNVNAEPPSTATNPWPTPVFNGQIVVCDRGVYARTIKGLNVKNAGGAGMILVNGEADGEAVIADRHQLPATHLGYVDGVALKQWLASGTGHTGRLDGATLQGLADVADILSVSSGRGPVRPYGTMKPNVSAPGTDILAAGRTGSSIVGMSGTSMATPHVSGAAALLLGANPTWGPSEVESALVTTARPSVKLADNSTPASVFEQGAGVVDLAQAVRAGLSFPVDRAAFIAARTDNDAVPVPANLNLPSIVGTDCFETCSFTRQVKANVAGTWRATVALDGATASVTPAEFTLAAGATRTVTVTVNPAIQSLAMQLEGAVTFAPTDAGIAASRVPMAIVVSSGTAPQRVQVTTEGESGFTDIAVNGLIGLPHARFAGTRLVAPTRKVISTRQDTTSDDPYNGFVPADAGNKWLLLTVDADGPARIVANASSATANDVDLFVGLDANGDRMPQATEVLCVSGSPTATERCIGEMPEARAGDRFWVLAQNFRSDSDTTPVTTDDVVVEAAAISLVPVNEEFVATGPGHTRTREAFDVRAAWNVPDLLPGTQRWGYVLVGAVPEHPSAAAQILVELSRSNAGTPAAQALVPGDTRTMALAAGAVHDRLFIDVPPNAATLTVTTAGSGEVDLYVAKANAPSSPIVGAAPARGAAAGTSIHPGAAETVTLAGAVLTPGRWYVTPVNAGATSADFTLKADLTYGGARAQPKFGPYYNPAGTGSGLFLFPAGQAWGLAWYTYLQDGSPTWYLGVLDAPTANQGVWTVTMQRQTWDGAVSTGTTVGFASLSLIDADRFTFSYSLDGQSGSETMHFVDGGGCPTMNGVKAPISGLWYAVGPSGTGYSINTYPGLESNGAFFYDALGLPRWAIGQLTPFQSGERTFPMVQQFGPCPLCTYFPPTSTEIGTLTRTFTDASNGHIALDLELVAPISGSWTIDLPVARVSNDLVCQ